MSRLQWNMRRLRDERLDHGRLGLVWDWDLRHGGGLHDAFDLGRVGVGAVFGGAFVVLSVVDSIRNIGRHTAERGRRIKSGFTSPISGGAGPKKKGKGK